MTDKEHAVYGVIVELIYIHGGSVNNDPKWISGWFSNMGAAAVRNTIESLVMLGKIQIEGDQITNVKASEVMGVEGKFGVPAEPEKPKKKRKTKPKTERKLSENAEKTERFSRVSSEFSGTTLNENRDLAPTDKRRRDKRKDNLIDAQARAREQGDIEQAVELYNLAASENGWSRCMRLTDARKSKVKRRLKDVGGLDGWKHALALAAESPFLCGETKEGFTLGIDFLLQESSFTKLMEGRYAKRTTQAERDRPTREDITKFAARNRGKLRGG